MSIMFCHFREHKLLDSTLSTVTDKLRVGWKPREKMDYVIPRLSEYT